MTDVDVFCYLCVRTKGAVTPLYMTEGMHRATHQNARMGVNSNAWPYPELPHHSFRVADRKALVPGQPCHVQFHLIPASFEMLPGDSLVVIICASDDKHFDTNKSNPFEICVGGKQYASSITIPTQDASAIKTGQIQVDINPVSAASEDMKIEKPSQSEVETNSSSSHQTATPKSATAMSSTPDRRVTVSTISV